ncbi:peptidoglycan editing factor PgeF [Bacillus sp. SB49]|uniref:peptidoglycan editing factor PgeF n=1 Tax=Bacillaceae TaxID=186817 RepID=UPI00041CC986|nr:MULTISPECIES: peptidoglycan editing factor PgeF [Bacillaceae]QHT46572.1 peptidoglycan editing factor PgeF [Bacillus sp. SB49]
MEPFKRKSEKQLACLENFPELVAGISTRSGGCSQNPYHTLNMGLHVEDEAETVVKNRQRLAEELAFPLESWVIGEQIHGTKIHVVQRSDRGKGAASHATAVAGVDGLITKERGILLAAFFADCVPLYFYDPETGWIGIAHAGWKGTVKEMAGKMLDALLEQGCRKEDIRVIIGPSIGMERYEVDDKVADAVPDAHKKACLIEQEAGKYLLDLKSLHAHMLIKKGIPLEHLHVSGYCTYEEEAVFYSHRRDHGKTGRMLGFIGLPE